MENTEIKNITMDDILNASFGETGSAIRASFKKTINIRQYETEVVELNTTLNIEKQLNGIERMIVCGILQAQLEYEAYTGMYVKGYVTETEFMKRKNALECEVNALCNKGRTLLNKDIGYLISIVENKE